MKRMLSLLSVCCATTATQAAFDWSVSANASIPDGDPVGMASRMVVSGQTAPISGLAVSLDISGSYNGDLYVYLTHGTGFAVLLNRVGVGAGSSLGYGDDGVNVTFTESAPNIHDYRLALFGDANHALGGALTGNWAPDGRAVSPLSIGGGESVTASLASFKGLDANGEWVLYVADVNGGTPTN